MKRKVFYAFIIFFIVIFAVPISEGQQGEEEILRELFIDSQKIIINVGSGGRTDKNYFRIDIKKEHGIGKAPHYVLGIYRIKKDECKAIVPDGVDLVFDFNKDLGLSGIFTISIKNKIFVNSTPTSAKQSLPVPPSISVKPTDTYSISMPSDASTEQGISMFAQADKETSTDDKQKSEDKQDSESEDGKNLKKDKGVIDKIKDKIEDKIKDYYKDKGPKDGPVTLPPRG